ncbi:MAG: AAA family ATPase [Microscillaceae bacterium]|nr:AAA family ATPase [Microscillaceae bacterium]
MKTLQKLPLGIQTFRKIREDNLLYVDKTEYIYHLIEKGSRLFFARPRRFGKSLLISTLKEIFLGSRSLFQGLWIEDQITWETYPVIHLDMSKLGESPHVNIEALLELQLLRIAESYALSLSLKSSNPYGYFQELIEGLHQKYQKKVVILIDEYDAPLTNVLDNPEKLEENRSILASLYGNLKAEDAYIHFVFLTGISRYGKMNVFSKLNNLTDLSFEEEFGTMLGYTQEEMETHFEPYIAHYAQKTGIAYSEALEQLKHWYNGYLFAEGTARVYTPWSVLSFCVHLKINNYWFETGTPTFLIKMLKEQQLPLYDLEQVQADDITLKNADLGGIDAYALLFQTGYLTIKRSTNLGMDTIYELSYPNQEVRLSFLNYLLVEYTGKGLSRVQNDMIFLVKKAFYENNLPLFFEAVKTTFAGIPYNMFIHNQEAYYQSVVYILVELSGLVVRGEEQTNVGRMDAVIESPTHIYIFEFKMTTASDALAQIHQKKYYEKYAHSPKEIVLVAVAFDETSKSLKEWISEVWDRS